MTGQARTRNQTNDDTCPSESYADNFVIALLLATLTPEFLVTLCRGNATVGNAIPHVSAEKDRNKNSIPVIVRSRAVAEGWASITALQQNYENEISTSVRSTVCVTRPNVLGEKEQPK